MNLPSSTGTGSLSGFNPAQLNFFGSGGSAARPSTLAAPASGYVGPLAGQSFLGQPFAFYLGAILLLVLLKFAGEHERSPLAHEVSGIHVGGFNLLKITAAAAVGLATLKLIFTRFPVPGLSQFVNYV